MDLYPYQQIGHDFLVRIKRGILADAPGLGKTPQSLRALETAGAFPAWVVTLSSTKFQWEDEIRRWLPHRSSVVLEGTSPYLIPDCDIRIINWDILSWWISTFNQRREAVVLDEFHLAKTHEAKRTTAAQTLCWGVPNLHLLSGTPILNRPSEMIVPLGILGHLKAFGGRDGFINRYCAPRSVEVRGRRVIDSSGSSNLEELNFRLRKMCYLRREKDEAEGLPPITRPRVLVDIDNRDEYRRVVADVKCWLQDQAVGRNSSRLAGLSEDDRTQMESEIREAVGERITEEVEPLVRVGQLRRVAARGKIKAVQEWMASFLSGSSEKIVLFAHHREVVEALLRSTDAIAIAGSSRQKREAQIRFTREESERVAVGQFQAAGTGLNLQAASHVGLVEFPWTPAEVDQLESRCHRTGATKSVTVWNFVAKDTIDLKSLELLQSKEEVFSSGFGRQGWVRWLEQSLGT